MKSELLACFYPNCLLCSQGMTIFTTSRRVKGNQITITVFADGKPIGTRTSHRDFRFAVVAAGRVISWHQSRKTLAGLAGTVVEIAV